MFEINDKVLYGTDGVCVVEDIAQRTFGGVTETYYILKPYSGSLSSIMIPVSNEHLVSRILRGEGKNTALSLCEVCVRSSSE